MPVSYPVRVIAAFDRFWAAYPPRPVNPRARALAVFARLVKEGEDPEALVAAAGRFAEAVNAERIRPIFVPHARTWLHGRDFEDFAIADAPAPAEPAQPVPEHPLAWLKDHMTTQAWASWIERLTVTGEPGAIVITAPLELTRDRVVNEYGQLIRRRLGDVTWRVERRS
jgi:hypothetical protein